MTVTNFPRNRGDVQVVALTTVPEWRAAAVVMQVLRPSLNVEE